MYFFQLPATFPQGYVSRHCQCQLAHSFSGSLLDLFHLLSARGLPVHVTLVNNSGATRSVFPLDLVFFHFI